MKNNILKEYKVLLRSIPGLVTSIFVVSVVIMNLMAGKTIIMAEKSWLGITGGLLLSWIPFLCMDIVTKSFGKRAAIMLNIFGLLVNLVSVGFFQLVTMINVGANTAENYATFNSVFAQTWQILLASSIAFVVSGVVNSLVNAAIGERFSKNPDEIAAYVTRTYVSTAIGQFVDNLIFTALAFLVFFKLSIGTTCGWTWLTVLGTAIFGALLELVMEMIFSPVGYKICQNWKKEQVGQDYLNYMSEK